MGEQRFDELFGVEGKQVIHVPAGQGEGLRVHLHAHGIESAVSPLATAPYDRVEVEGDVSAETLQALVDHWAR